MKINSVPGIKYVTVHHVDAGTCNWVQGGWDLQTTIQTRNGPVIVEKGKHSPIVITLASIVKENGKVHNGIAKCATGDHFCRRRGSSIAVGRALKFAGYTKMERKQALKEFFSGK